MSSAYEVCLYLFLLPSSTLVVAAALPLLLLFVAAALFCPGGLVWSQSSCSSSISGPGGLTAAIALAGSTAHLSLAALFRHHAATRLIVFSIDLTRFIISSHPETACEILNSSAFADRPIKEFARELLFHRAMGFAPFGEYWRKLRRISGTYLFCHRRIGGFGEQRREFGEDMVGQVRNLMRRNGAVE